QRWTGCVDTRPDTKTHLARSEPALAGIRRGRMCRRHRDLNLVEVEPDSLGPRDACQAKIGVGLIEEFRGMVQQLLPQSLLIADEKAYRTVCPVKCNQIAPWQLCDDIDASGRKDATEQADLLRESSVVGYLKGGAHHSKSSILVAHLFKL